MNYKQLGSSDLQVSELCLGTMTFGEQNSEAEAHVQLDMAVDYGVNFIDTAELYPVPPKADTQGRTEQFIGTWLKNKRREDVVIASKIAGPSRGLSWIRSDTRINREHLQAAIHTSLIRLQTDYVDLYQIHWPDRNVPMFGSTSFDVSQERATESIHVQLQALSELVQEGKIRYIGLSNETPWGVSEFQRCAKDYGLPQVVSIQNAYHLMNRTFEAGLAEVCFHEHIGLLAYSPLAFGHLSGKYIQNKQAKGRISQFANFGQRYAKPNVPDATMAYVHIAQQAGLSPTQLALAFVRTRWFTSSVIIGATNVTQLKENLESDQVQLSDESLAQIEAVHQRYPNPAP